MDKNWLIRTTQNKILGPISKEKLIEFIEKGSLTQSDEVCSGNGYWFYLHEQDLVDLHIVGNTPQGYNPISEGKTVLARKRRTEDKSQAECDATTNSTMVIGRDILSQLATTPDDDSEEPIQAKNSEQEKKNQVLPNEADLEFPDLGDEFELPSIEIEDEEIENEASASSSTGVIDIHHDDSSLKAIEDSENDQFQGKLPSDDDLAFPEPSKEPAQQKASTAELELNLPAGSEKKKNKQGSNITQGQLVASTRSRSDHSNRRKNQSLKIVDQKHGRSDRYLFVIFFLMISIVVYAVYFYYSKISSQRTFNAIEEVSSHIVTSAIAQDSTSKKKALIPTMTFKGGTATASVSTIGARVAIDFERVETGKCPISNSFQLLFAILSAEENYEQRERELSDCSFLLDADARRMLQIAKMPPQSRRAWLSSNMNKLPKADQQIIHSIFAQRDNKVQLKIFVNKFNEYVEFLSRSPTDAQLYRFNEELVSLCQKEGSGSILAELIEVLVALSIENQAWAKSIFAKILHRNLMQIVFFLDPSFFSSTYERIRYQNNMRRAMVYIVDHLNDKIFAQLAINYFSIFDQSEITMRLIQKADAAWSLSDIRKYLQKPIYGEFFFLPWFYILQSRAQEQEVVHFVETYLTPDVISKLRLDIIPVIALYFPKGSRVRQRLVEMIRENYNAESLFHRFQIIEALKIPFIRDELQNRPDSFKGASFQLERNFFRELLERGGIAHFSLFNLYKLGEENRSLLWWLVL